VTEGPGRDSPGGVAFRPGRCAKLRHLLKHWEYFQLPSRDIRLSARDRLGVWRGRLDIMADKLTGESPTSSCTTTEGGRASNAFR